MTEILFGPLAPAVSFIRDLFDISDEVPGTGHYENCMLIVEYDKADEVSGEMIYFYRATTYLLASYSNREEYLYRDHSTNYSYPSIMNRG